MDEWIFMFTEVNIKSERENPRKFCVNIYLYTYKPHTALVCCIAAMQKSYIFMKHKLVFSF